MAQAGQADTTQTLFRLSDGARKTLTVYRIRAQKSMYADCFSPFVRCAHHFTVRGSADASWLQRMAAQFGSLSCCAIHCRDLSCIARLKPQPGVTSSRQFRGEKVSPAASSAKGGSSCCFPVSSAYPPQPRQARPRGERSETAWSLPLPSASRPRRPRAGSAC